VRCAAGSGLGEVKAQSSHRKFGGELGNELEMEKKGPGDERGGGKKNLNALDKKGKSKKLNREQGKENQRNSPDYCLGGGSTLNKKKKKKENWSLRKRTGSVSQQKSND